MTKVTKKEYRVQIKKLKHLLKYTETVAEQGTAWSNPTEAIRACAAIQYAAADLALVMQALLEEETK
jgi:hypothetical protein